MLRYLRLVSVALYFALRPNVSSKLYSKEFYCPLAIYSRCLFLLRRMKFRVSQFLSPCQPDLCDLSKILHHANNLISANTRAELRLLSEEPPENKHLQAKRRKWMGKAQERVKKACAKANSLLVSFSVISFTVGHCSTHCIYSKAQCHTPLWKRALRNIALRNTTPSTPCPPSIQSYCLLALSGPSLSFEAPRYLLV